ncbi:uncharacterized protein LY89DRAFT_685416 [Mollisia scopiformis]|uniref:Uncharacterized protein n=1 Tax=Mollisia scopiformis TaxID=149040 RepID=A0A194X8F5_MOLSC|nr:uncharacterized protein LY89DRAFT_685416 [Mollisia scopiformis]KUJ16451.1 hypothetical protein LY89DRAFT_685416 [Mollisia scopiformis]
MPFDYEAYQKKCNVMTAEQLQKEWENYTRQISAGATGTATSVLLMPYTAGISLVGLGVSAPRIHNARKKMEIIEAGLQARGASPHTRKRDVLAAVGVSGAVSGLTLGIVPPGTADLAIGAAVHHGLEYASTQAALGGSGAVLVHTHDEYVRKKAAEDEIKLQQTMDHLNLDGALAESSVYNPMLHTSHTWPMDSASIADTVKTGPVATPFVDEDSVLFQPTFDHVAQSQSLPNPQPIPNSISHDGEHVPLTEAQLDMLRRMELLQFEMEKRRAGFQEPAAEPSFQQASQEHGLTSPAQVDGQGLGILGLNHLHSSPILAPQLSNHLAQPEQLDLLSSPPHFARPNLYPRSESLPVNLSAIQDRPRDDQEEQLPSYQPQYIAPMSQVETSSQSNNYTLSTKPPLPPRNHTQDSGYHSLTSTPSMTNSTLQSTYPTQNFLSTQVSSPQPYASPSDLARKPMPSTMDSGLHRHSHVTKRHRASEPSISSPSASVPPAPSRLGSIPPPPPYTHTPPPSVVVTADRCEVSKDYFSLQNSGDASSSPRPSLAKKKSQAILKGVNQGWQWAKALPIPGDFKAKENIEPDYGPSPEIPAAWRGA